jgi:hypothetical protein
MTSLAFSASGRRGAETQLWLFPLFSFLPQSELTSQLWAPTLTASSSSLTDKWWGLSPILLLLLPRHHSVHFISFLLIPIHPVSTFHPVHIRSNMPPSNMSPSPVPVHSADTRDTENMYFIERRGNVYDPASAEKLKSHIILSPVSLSQQFMQKISDHL